MERQESPLSDTGGREFPRVSQFDDLDYLLGMMLAQTLTNP